jgi:hypothetical protein
MASVETTTIRVRRSTHKRLQEEADRQGTSVTELLDQAADILEERSMLLSAERAWERMAEMPAEEFALDGALADEEIAQLEPNET